MNTINQPHKISARGLVIKIYLEDFINDQHSHSDSDMRKKLQLLLNKKLSFKTIVSDIKIEECFSFGYVSFDSEYGDKRVINFTIKAGIVQYA